MLILTGKHNGEFVIRHAGEEMRIKVLGFRKGKGDGLHARLGFAAADSFRIDRVKVRVKRDEQGELDGMADLKGEQ